MNKKENYVLKPIKFSSITHIGEGGLDLLVRDYYLSKLIVQNILYLAYHEAKTIEEISDFLDVRICIIEEIVEYLVSNGFIDKISGSDKVSRNSRKSEIKYQTKILIHDLALEVYENMKKIYQKYAKIICEKYIPLLMDNGQWIMDNCPGIYIPENDINFFAWTMVTFACCKKFDIPELNEVLNKHFIKRSDGGDFVSSACIERENFISQENDFNRLLGQSSLITTSDKLSAYLWKCNTIFDDRIFDGMNSLHIEFVYTYDFIKNQLKNNKENAVKFERLFNSRFLQVINPTTSTSSDEDNNQDLKIAVNLIVSTLTMDEIMDLLPDMPEEFIALNDELSNELYETCKSQYPEHIQSLCSDFYRKSISSSEMLICIIEHLLEKGILKPLSEIQRKTVNMIMFSDVLPQ